MRVFVLPIVITILVWVLNHNIKKNKVPNKVDVRTYLAREDAANSTRKKDISKLPYIQVPIESFPFDITLNDEKKQLQIANYKEEILNLAKKPMLNLIGVSNTELKESYGPANLEILSNYDQNYSRYIRALHLYAEAIYEEYPEKAISVLEYCISIGTDISGTYDLLARYYLSKGDRQHFEALYDKIPDKTSISGKTIQSKLDRISEIPV
ncbi:MAG: hypothetical protein ACI4A3_14070 [Lachnospiraceae bacterium]